MIKAKHVILRSVSGPATRGRGGGRVGPATLQPAAAMAVEVEDLPAQRVAEVSSRADVESVAPVIPMKLIAPVEAAADDPLSGGSTWGIKAVGANASPFSGKGVRVAVLDTGIDPGHAAFQGVELVRKNFTAEGEDDLHGHGTHCAGTIFGRDVDGTRIGVARGVETALIGKVLGAGGGGSDVVLAAIQWAIQEGAHVISMSLGIDFPGYVKELEGEGMPTELATSLALEGYRANILLFERLASLVRAQAAFREPCVLVAAAGNESRRDEDEDFVLGVAPPAAAEGMVSVAAVGLGGGSGSGRGRKSFAVAPFSNTGARLAGPGVGVLSAKPGGGLTSMSGTSMATPHVAGVAALWGEKLRKTRQFTQQRFTDHLVTSATTEGLKRGVKPVDIGNGLIRAPK